MRSPPFLLLAVAAALAGCAGADAGPEDGPPGGDAATLAPGPTPDATPEPPAPPVTLDTAVHVEGSTALGACAAGQCHYEMTDTAFGVLPDAGVGLRLVGTLTWTAVGPTSQELTLYVPTYADGQYHWEPGYPAASGPSPLAFDLDLAGLGSSSLGLIVGNGVAAGSPAGVFAVQTPQEFVLDAVYTTAA